MQDTSNPCDAVTAPIKKPKATLETSDLKLREDKRRREHERNQNFQDLYYDVINCTIKLVIPGLCLLLFYAKYIHNEDLANCVFCILSNLIACFIGALIGKYITN